MADKKAPGFLIPAIIFILGLCILLYPTVSDLWNQFRQNQLIGDYQEAVQQLSDEDYARAKAAAKRYNASLQVSFADAFSSTKSEASSDDEYWQLLNVAGNGVMAYVEIPKISTRLAIYHGLSDEVLQTGLGHVLGTSLPIGGNGTHCVVAGHRGLPSALLLTDLDQVVEGDRFAVYVLDEKHCYEVDQISVVDPEDISTLEIDENQDYFTFITCTPYGVNTQRLLVRGHAVEDDTQLGSVDPWQQFLTSLGWQGKLALALIALLVVALIVRALKRRNQKNAQNINKLGAFSVLLVAAVSFCVIPGQAQALTTPDLSQKGSIMLSCAYDSTPISELEASLYQVAQFKEDGSFELDDAFAATDIDLNTLSAASEWRSAATTLLKHARENKLSSSSLKANKLGVAYSGNLEPGMYLVSITTKNLDGYKYSSSPVLLSVPSMTEDENSWTYNVFAQPKFERTKIKASGTATKTSSKDSGATSKDSQAGADDSHGLLQTGDIDRLFLILGLVVMMLGVVGIARAARYRLGKSR